MSFIMILERYFTILDVNRCRCFNSIFWLEIRRLFSGVCMVASFHVLYTDKTGVRARNRLHGGKPMHRWNGQHPHEQMRHRRRLHGWGLSPSRVCIPDHKQDITF